MAGSGDTSVHVRSSDPRIDGAGRTFSGDIEIGRSDECDVRTSAEMVSRSHCEVRFEDGDWLIEDLNSKNGLYVDGEAVDNLVLGRSAEVSLGTGGPRLQIDVVEDRSKSPGGREGNRSGDGTGTGVPRSEVALDESEECSRAGSHSDSLSRYVEYYLEGEGGRAGDTTRRIREAYRHVRSRKRRAYLGILGGVLLLCILLSGYALYHHLRQSRLEKEAERVWARVKQQEIMITRLQQSVEASEDAELENQLAALEREWKRQQDSYRGYVEELGLQRDLTRKERQIYRVARLFGESEFSVPAGFVRKVQKKIQTYWKGRARASLRRSIKRAERNGYTTFIVETMQEHDLPPEFFYLALQESRFRTDAVGPRTRWGIAKGMWQFIPKTARKYGLELGPRANQRVVDSQDERHSVRKSTRAAADYLKRIYSTRAQASGLLVIASYNWGEHRVVEKMRELPGPQGIPKEALEGIPENPQSRNYWQFLTTYKDRMPAETKDYVLKIFSAAVIGQNPPLFGFSFDNPLREPLEAPTRTMVVSPSSDSASDRDVSVRSGR